MPVLNQEILINPELSHACEPLRSLVSDNMIFFMFFPIQAYVKHVTPGAGQFWPEVYNVNKKPGRGSLGDASYQI